jgi:hypothetical protein
MEMGRWPLQSRWSGAPLKEAVATLWNLPLSSTPLYVFTCLNEPHIKFIFHKSSLVNPVQIEHPPSFTRIQNFAHVDKLLQRTQFAGTLFQVISSEYFCVHLRIQVPGTFPFHLGIQVWSQFSIIVCGIIPRRGRLDDISIRDENWPPFCLTFAQSLELQLVWFVLIFPICSLINSQNPRFLLLPFYW